MLHWLCPPRSAAWKSPLQFAALGLLISLALVARLWNLAALGDNYDEGVYLESLLLMRHGYRPFFDIVATQGPLHLHLAYLSYALGGYTLSAARGGSVVASLIGVCGAGWAAHRLAGPIGGLATMLVLGLSPTYLAIARQALPEAPAIGLVALAVAAAATANRTDDDTWRWTAGLLLGLGCMIKPAVAPAALPVLWLTTNRRCWQSALPAALAALGIGILGFAIVGVTSPIDHVVGWRLAGHQFDPAAFRHNAGLLQDKMYHQEQPALYALAAVGGLLLVRRSPAHGLPIVGWLGAQLGILLCYTNLSAHLGATLTLPLAILAGAGLALGTQKVWAARRSVVAWLAASIAIWYLVSVPQLLERDQRLVSGLLSTDRDGDSDELAAVQRIVSLTDEDDFVVTDAPMLAFLADRLVPPALVDPSDARIQAGALTGENVLAGLRAYDPELIVLWTGKLARLPAVQAAVDRDFAVRAEFGLPGTSTPRAIYEEREEDDD